MAASSRQVAKAWRANTSRPASPTGSRPSSPRNSPPSSPRAPDLWETTFLPQIQQAIKENNITDLFHLCDTAEKIINKKQSRETLIAATYHLLTLLLPGETLPDSKEEIQIVEKYLAQLERNIKKVGKVKNPMITFKVMIWNLLLDDAQKNAASFNAGTDFENGLPQKASKSSLEENLTAKATNNDSTAFTYPPVDSSISLPIEIPKNPTEETSPVFSPSFSTPDLNEKSPLRPKKETNCCMKFFCCMFSSKVKTKKLKINTSAENESASANYPRSPA